jgi:esterase/lipase superfamily enzyme
MEIITYGHYGPAILLFPAKGDSPYENEENGLIESIGHLIEKGKFKIYSVSNCIKDSWQNPDLTPKEQSVKMFQYNKYLIEEVVPFIFGDCGCAVPIITCGASTGAFYAANSFFRRPDIFLGLIAMSGFYNIENFAKGYYDDNCYFNSPMHFLPNLTDPYWLSFLSSKRHIYLFSGSGPGEQPGNTQVLDSILSAIGIPHQISIWGNEWSHNWKTWKAMLLKVLDNKF